jgi:hypothetical protein
LHRCPQQGSTMAVVLNEQQMLQFGLEIAGFRLTTPKTDLRRFRDLYGGDPGVTASVFQDIQTLEIGEAKIKKVCLVYFLMALYYVRGYGVENRVMTVFGLKCTKLFRKHVWGYLTAIQALKAHKVSIELLDILKTCVYLFTNSFFFSFLVLVSNDVDSLAFR